MAFTVGSPVSRSRRNTDEAQSRLRWNFHRPLSLKGPFDFLVVLLSPTGGKIRPLRKVRDITVSSERILNSLPKQDPARRHQKNECMVSWNTQWSKIKALQTHCFRIDKCSARNESEENRNLRIQI